ncbi:nucleotidyltransferase [Herminiimonas glaciei]|uniref:Nucleotidyltransferase n=1 Tax=Herminiimonas glaciei TaxID=523788 RepID=A0ABW2I8Y5_9BURK|nr:nucleotidyltransferase [Herminiimonas sp. KBW02]
MKRDIFPPQKHGYSGRSSSAFFRLAEVIGKSNEPTQTQFSILQRAYESTAEHLAESTSFKDQFEEIHAHGSRQLGTLVRPRDEGRDGFDVDLIARLPHSAYYLYSDTGGPSRLLMNLFQALQSYADKHQLQIRKWERCVTLEYASGMTADIAPVIDAPQHATAYGDTHALIPDRDQRAFHSTNPRGYAKWFDQVAAISPIFTLVERSISAMDSVYSSTEIAPLPDAQEVFQRMLCRLVQMVKLHRNEFFFGKKDAPSSTFITTLAALAYEDQARIPHETPLDLLLDIVHSLPLYFSREPVGHRLEEWRLDNPSTSRDNLASGMNTPAHQAAFWVWHAQLVGDIKDLVISIEDRAGFDILHKKIQRVFGDRAARAIQQNQLEHRNTERKAGTVTLLTASAVPMTIGSKSHNFFGKP